MQSTHPRNNHYTSKVWGSTLAEIISFSLFSWSFCFVCFLENIFSFFDRLELRVTIFPRIIAPLCPSCHIFSSFYQLLVKLKQCRIRQDQWRFKLWKLFKELNLKPLKSPSSVSLRRFFFWKKKTYIFRARLAGNNIGNNRLPSNNRPLFARKRK